MRPYQEQLTETNIVIREFLLDIDPMSLVWHEDQEDRIIEVLVGNGWRFQYDEDLPFEMITGDRFEIPRGYLHRVIKGNGTLKIKIIKK
jgi:quercetin dioxygenase-like cupin family protein